MKDFWETYFTKKGANNLLYMIWTWEHADVGAQHRYASKEQIKLHSTTDDLNPKKDSQASFEQALNVIEAKTVILPSRTDLYFPPENSEEEAKIMGKRAELKVIESDRGHWAGFNIEEDTKFLDDCPYKLLQEPWHPSA